MTSRNVEGSKQVAAAIEPASFSWLHCPSTPPAGAVDRPETRQQKTASTVEKPLLDCVMVKRQSEGDRRRRVQRWTVAGHVSAGCWTTWRRSIRDDGGRASSSP